jgi:hypothetical protein
VEVLYAPGQSWPIANETESHLVRLLNPGNWQRMDMAGLMATVHRNQVESLIENYP